MLPLLIHCKKYFVRLIFIVSHQWWNFLTLKFSQTTVLYIAMWSLVIVLRYIVVLLFVPPVCSVCIVASVCSICNVPRVDDIRKTDKYRTNLRKGSNLFFLYPNVQINAANNNIMLISNTEYTLLIHNV